MWKLIHAFIKILALFTPQFLIPKVYHLCVGQLSIALCLHRVTTSRRISDPYPPNTIEESKLTALLASFLPHHRLCTDSLLTVSFDDGYEDAASYVERYADAYPLFEWILFICPFKLEKRQGFRWDLYEEDTLTGQAEKSFSSYLFDHQSIDQDQKRVELSRISDLPNYQLAKLDQIKNLMRKPNVFIGNHSNSHFKLSSINYEDARNDIDQSFKDFKRILGSTTHFAFPFGTPLQDYNIDHVDIIRKSEDVYIWNTYSEPYELKNRKKGTVLPRFVIIGTWSPKRIALFISLLCLKFRIKKTFKVKNKL